MAVTANEVLSLVQV